MEKTILEIFTLVTGIIYIILEIRQKNAMWIVGILTSIAAMAVFFRMGLYVLSDDIVHRSMAMEERQKHD